MIAAGAEARGTEPRVLEHQVQLDREQRRVEHDEPAEAEPDLADRRPTTPRGAWAAPR